MLLMWCVLWRMFKMCWIGFLILTAGTMMISVLSNIITCSPMKVRSYFRGTYCLSLKDQRVRHARNQPEVGSKQNFTLWYWECRWYVPLNVGPLLPEYTALCYKDRNVHIIGYLCMCKVFACIPEINILYIYMGKNIMHYFH